MNHFIVDAFTDKPFGGNPAGVVLLDSDSFPKEELMLKIAAELRYSETAFGYRHPHQIRWKHLRRRHSGSGCGRKFFYIFAEDFQPQSL